MGIRLDYLIVYKKLIESWGGSEHAKPHPTRFLCWAFVPIHMPQTLPIRGREEPLQECCKVNRIGT